MLIFCGTFEQVFIVQHGFLDTDLDLFQEPQHLTKPKPNPRGKCLGRLCGSLQNLTDSRLWCSKEAGALGVCG